MDKNRQLIIGIATLIVALALGQVVAYLIAPASWDAFVARLPVIIAMVAFWGPICVVFAAVFVYITMRLLGFESLAEIRLESVEQNNPTPAILFVGTLIASVLFLSLVIRT